MPETRFEIHYHGEGTHAGRMSVRDLAPSLLSLAELFSEASLILYPENGLVSLEVEATREGSFAVDLVLQESGAAWNQIGTHTLADAGGLVLFKELIIGDSIDFSLIGLVKWLHGRRVSDEVPGPEPETVTLLAGEDRAVVRTEVAALNRDLGVRAKLRDAVSPLRRKGIETIEFVCGGRPSVELVDEDLPAFELPEEVEEETISEQEIDAYLEVLSPTFEDGNKWKFFGLGDKFSAPIFDTEFGRAVARHEERFGAGDQLWARLQIIQRRNRASGAIKTERRVVEVYEKIEPPHQLSIGEEIDAAGEAEAEAPSL